jgi:predicted membrane protein
VNLPIPVASGPVTIKGLFQGSGTAQLFVRYNTGGGTAFAFPNSVDGALVVPEPASPLLCVPLFSFLLLRKRAYRG